MEGSKGFGTHPHKDMEIISIPLSGALEHRDSMGHGGIIYKGDIQVMSAGTGATHSEFNANKTEPVQFLQIWVFPRDLKVTPRYDQISLDRHHQKNGFTEIISPNKDNDTTWIHQDAWFSLCNWDKDIVREYTIKRQGNGLYIFLIKGKIQIGDQIVNTRDGYGIWETDHVTLKALESSEILLMDIPMELPYYLK